MRVVEPHHFKTLEPTKESRNRFLRVAAVLSLGTVLSGAVYAFNLSQGNPPQPSPPSAQNITLNDEQTDEGQPEVLRIFSGEEFKAFYKSVSYPNTQNITEPPDISGNTVADDRMRELAEERGYELSVVPIAPIVRIHEPRLDTDDLLQPLAAEGWNQLKKAAQEANMPLAISSAYRSPEYQRDLFMNRLLALGVSVEQIANGEADWAVLQILATTALPGYSRHHSGYTIDLWCEDGSTAFLSSQCFRWISADNYRIAKENGWIPSYPEGTSLQGPEPEPWEYVWVGKKSLLQ